MYICIYKHQALSVSVAVLRNRIKFLPAYCPLCQLGSLGDDGEGPFPLWDPGSRCRTGKAAPWLKHCNDVHEMLL